MSTAERTYDYPQDRWHGPGYALALMHPGWIVLMILGFIFWWPVGLAFLAFMIWSRAWVATGSDRWHRKMERMEEKMGRMRERMGGSAASVSPRAATTRSTSTAPRRCAGSKRSSASSATSSTGCASPRTRPSSTSSWPIGAIARAAATAAAAELKSPAALRFRAVRREAGGPICDSARRAKLFRIVPTSSCEFGQAEFSSGMSGLERLSANKALTIIGPVRRDRTGQVP